MAQPLKLHLSIEEQIKKLESRGLIIDDREFAGNFLDRVNYYRISGYLFDFKDKKCDKYIEGITFSRIARIYEFDTKFTRLLLYVLEDIEESFKTRFSYALSSEYPDDPLIYLNDRIYVNKEAVHKFEELFNVSKTNNKEIPFIKHHYKYYDGKLPIWVAVEIMTMGNIKSLFKNLRTPIKKRIAKKYSTGADQLDSWIENLAYTRNHLAHYMRIYNYNFGRIPKSCSNHPIQTIYRGMIFDQVAIMSFLFSNAEEWKGYVLPEMEELFEQYGDVIELSGLGFPVNWRHELDAKS